MDSVIQISMPGAATLIVAAFGSMFLFGRILLSQFERRMSDRLQHLEQGLATESRRNAEITTRLQELAASLPLEYVRREDWIRFSVSIDSKLDRQAELLLRLLGGAPR